MKESRLDLMQNGFVATFIIIAGMTDTDGNQMFNVYDHASDAMADTEPRAIVRKESLTAEQIESAESNLTELCETTS